MASNTQNVAISEQCSSSSDSKQTAADILLFLWTFDKQKVNQTCNKEKRKRNFKKHGRDGRDLEEEGKIDEEKKMQTDSDKRRNFSKLLILLAWDFTNPETK